MHWRAFALTPTVGHAIPMRPPVNVLARLALVTVEANCAEVVVLVIAAMNKGLDMVYLVHAGTKLCRA